MERLCVALYARVSSQRQADELTIRSQVAALRQRIEQEGLAVEDELVFLDEGYSGSTLVRPALERLRDLVHFGGVDRVYVHSPDRLARKYLYQMLLLEEFQRHAVQVVFLNHDPKDQSAESELLLQVQGMIAEYERAKILERTRRGRRFSARQGKVSALGHAPYGYRYLSRHQQSSSANSTSSSRHCRSPCPREAATSSGSRCGMRTSVDSLPRPQARSRIHPNRIDRRPSMPAAHGQF